jgi:hypothetical protein
VKLPSGDPVEVSIEAEGMIIARNVDIAPLKQQVTTVLQEQVWRTWLDKRLQSPPPVAIPDAADPSAVIPEIVEEACGVYCPVTGEEMVAFGTVDIRGEEGLRYTWHRNLYDAQLGRDRAVARLEGLRRLLQDDAERVRLISEAEQLRQYLGELPNSYAGLLPDDLVERLRKLRSEKVPPYTPELTDWVARAYTLADRAETVGSEEQRLEEEAVLHDFGGDFLLLGNQEKIDYWVATPNGLLREPNKLTPRRTHGGSKIWKRVSKNEVALSWRVPARSTSPVFEVRHQPEDGCTDEQLAAVKQLEEQITARWSAPNSVRTAAGLTCWTQLRRKTPQE